MGALSGKELASMLGIDPSGVSRLCKKGVLVFIPGTKKYDEVDSLEAFKNYKSVESGQLINATEAATLLGTSKSTITSMKNAGKITPVQIGTHEVYFARGEIVACKSVKKEKIEQAEVVDEARKELEKKNLELKNQLLQQKLDEKNGILVNVATLTETLDALMSDVGTGLDSLGTKIIMQLSTCADDAQRSILIRNTIAEAKLGLLQQMQAS